LIHVVETVELWFMGKISMTMKTDWRKIIRRIQSNIDRKGFQVENEVSLENQIEWFQNLLMLESLIF
jgi:hypothetical protein